MIKKAIVFIFILSVSIYSVKAQTILINGIKFIPDSTVDLQKSIDFIKDVMGQDLSNENLILDNNPKIFKPLNCFDQILQDDYYLKKEEWLNVRDAKIPQLAKWVLKYHPTSSNNKSEKKDANSKSINWPYFFKLIGGRKGLSDINYYYAVPIFLRTEEKSKYCIFYYRNDCGFDCGMADLSIYINNNGRWVKIKSYCGWMS